MSDDRKVVEAVRSAVVYTLMRTMRIVEKSTFTFNHSDRVAAITSSIANKLGFPEAELNVLWRASILHDIGKIGINNEIILAKRKLSNNEYESIKMHSEIGEYILNSNKYLQTEAEIVRQHHERFDGSGYPDGIAGKDIRIHSRIIALADVYDSLVDNRPYRKAWDQLKVIEFIKNESGKMFDPKIVDVLLALIGEGIVTELRKKNGYEG